MGMFRLSAEDFSKTVSTPRFRRIAAGILILAAVAVGAFGFRTYRSLVLLQSAREIGVPATSHVRPWMTLDVVAQSYQIPVARILEGLELPSDTQSGASIASLVSARGETSIAFLQRLQKVLADSATPTEPQPKTIESGWLSEAADAILSIVVRFGTPALAVTLFLAAIGLPLPSGLAATLAGTLAAQGRLDLAATVFATLFASLAGDIAGFALGRSASVSLLDRYGKYVGLSERRRSFIAELFGRWGALTILLSRTYVSSMSSVVNILAGAGGYSVARFVVVATMGRLLWTSAYLGVGYAVGDNAEAASEFLANLTRMLLSVLVCLVCAAALRSTHKPA